MNMHVNVPGKPQDSRARNLATQERRRQKTLQRLAGLRREAMAEIDRLIAFLDETDGYSTFECEVNGDEQDGAWLEGKLWPSTGPEDDEDDGLDEPSLAAPENHPNGYTDGGGSRNQEHWAAGNLDDRELDTSDDEPWLGSGDHDLEQDNSDYEPSLGWTVEGQAGSTDGSDRELENSVKPKRKPRVSHLGEGVRTAGQVWNSRNRLTGLTKQQAAAFTARLDRYSPISVR